MNPPVEPGTPDAPQTPCPWTGATLMTTYIGPLLLLSMALLSIVLVGSSSPQFGFGFTLGKIVTSVAFALPVYLVLRYFTSVGRRLNRLAQVNVVCLLTATVWSIQLVLAMLLPSFIAANTTNTSASQSVSPSHAGTESPVPWLRDGSDDRSQFTPVERPAAAVGCQNAAEQLKNCVCVRNAEGQRLQPWELPWDDRKKFASLIAQCVCGGVQIDLNDESCVKTVLVPGTTVQ